MFRIYIERKKGFDNEAARLFDELTGFLGVKNVQKVRYLNRYDIDGVPDAVMKKAVNRIFAEPQSDICYADTVPLESGDTVICWEYLPGQYDQRADSARQCLSLLFSGEKENMPAAAAVRCARMAVLSGSISAEETERIKKYLINPVDSREAAAEKPETLSPASAVPADVAVMDGFVSMDSAALEKFRNDLGLAMDADDVRFMQSYFAGLHRDPTETEVRVLDTYWSDHCRHTTFNTVLGSVTADGGPYQRLFESSLERYRSLRAEIYADGKDRPVTLMDMAVIGAKYLKKHGKLDDIELSDEINACSIYIDVHYTGKRESEKWLLMFKNETHNHPTEIEPFGGAATCIGGAIRDPLSGRAWVYQALRVTGAADPRKPLEQTLPGKLPQLKLTREAASGFSSYGNQIGLTTGQVAEIYDAGFEAKRMELGAVIAAAPADSVRRETPEAGDVVILVGGGTGRDGIGGATGSSKVHTEQSVTTAGAEVQKGNAVEERKIQRLFRDRNVARMIRRCNDFGAGGVAVAVGELAAGLEINLDAVPKKYDGLNGTELAISESQERMAVVVRRSDADAFVSAAAGENLSATVIAEVTEDPRLVMKWRGKTIVDIDRKFLDTAGAPRRAEARIVSPRPEDCPLKMPLAAVNEALRRPPAEAAVSPDAGSIRSAWLACLSDLACASQRGLGERFDGSIGSSSVLFPYGGRFQSTPEAGMAAKIPVLSPEETATASLMTFGYDPRAARWSPYHGAQTAVLYSLARIAALGGDASKARLTFQEYFERAVSPESWGKPAAALLGALDAQTAMGTAAIGGKDSMSGSYLGMTVPPTLVSFAVVTENAARVRGGAFTRAGAAVYCAVQPYKADDTPDFGAFVQNARHLYELNCAGKTAAAYPVGAGGIAEAVSKMAFGNMTGFAFDSRVREALEKTCPPGTVWPDVLFLPLYGTVVAEAADGFDVPDGWILLGHTQEKREINGDGFAVSLDDAREAWETPLARVFPPVSGKTAAPLPAFAADVHPSLTELRRDGIRVRDRSGKPAGPEDLERIARPRGSGETPGERRSARPKVLLPVFPGTNCEYDMARAFALAGAETEIFVFRNNTEAALRESLEQLARRIGGAQILALSGGFSVGDEPDGSGKFIANVLRERGVAQAVTALVEKRDGLVLGICNGFQALVRTGLVPYGRILEPDENMPALTYNTVGRHVSRIVKTRIVSGISPWARHPSVTDAETHDIPVSHGEGRVILEEEAARALFAAGQVFSQYTGSDGIPAMTEPDNPNGSMYAIEGMTNADGRILGKMGHSERVVGPGPGGLPDNVLKGSGIRGCQNIFAAGVMYFE